ncbi:MAG: hypothetical protein P8177_08830, partial [Gemmatimonadota bacterium]
VRDPSRIGPVADLVRPEDLRGRVHRELYEALIVHAGSGEADPIGMDVDDPARTLLESLLADRTELTDPDRSFWDAVETLRLRPQLEQLDELRRRLAEAECPDRDALYAEMVELQRTLHERAAELGTLGAKVSNRYRRYLKR